MTENKKIKNVDLEEVKRAVLSYIDFSDDKREFRKSRNSFNWDIWNLKQDWTHKTEKQSQEFVPLLSVILEQLVTTVLQALTGRSDEFFSVEEGKVSDDLFDVDTITKLLSEFLFETDIVSKLAEAIKYVGLDGIVTAKVYGSLEEVHRFKLDQKVDKFEERPELGGRVIGIIDDTKKRKKKQNDLEKVSRWKLAIDILPFDDFHFDPRRSSDGYKLFEIQVFEKDLHELIRLAEQPDSPYDLEQVKKIQNSFIEEEERHRKNSQADTPDVEPSFVKTVTLKECWGVLLKEDGTVLADNCVTTIANDQFVIRKPEKNPRFDGLSPYVTAGLIDNPRSAYPKAILDAPAAMNKTYNEFYNLCLDGGFAEAHDVREVNVDGLENPEQIEGMA